MGGPRLTPEQLERAAAIFAKTNNASAAAAAVGVNESTLRAALKRVRIARNRDLHRQAVERGLRTGRKHLEKVVDLLGQQLVDELEGGGLEPLERAQCTGALGTAMRELGRLQLLDLKRQQAALTRAFTRARIRAESDDGDGPKLTIPQFLTRERRDDDAVDGAPKETPDAEVG